MLISKARLDDKEALSSLHNWVKGFQKNAKKGTSVVRDPLLRTLIFPKSNLTFPDEITPEEEATLLGERNNPPQELEDEVTSQAPSSLDESVTESRLDSLETSFKTFAETMGNLLSGVKSELSARPKLDNIQEIIQETVQKSLLKMTKNTLPPSNEGTSSVAGTVDSDEEIESDSERASDHEYTKLLEIAERNEWRSCLNTIITPDCQLMVGESLIPLNQVEFEKMEKYPNTKWRYNDAHVQSVINRYQNKPPKQEVILYDKKKAETALIELSRQEKGGYLPHGILRSKKGEATNSAVYVPIARTPAFKKLLEAAEERRSCYIFNQKKLWLNEMKAFTHFLPYTEDTLSMGLAKAFSGPAFESDSAQVQAQESRFGSLSSDKIRKERDTRMLFLDLVSAIIQAEVSIWHFEGHAKECQEALVKRLLKSTMEAMYQWWDAKLAWRKEALKDKDFSKPHTKNIYSSNLLAEELFCPEAMEVLKQASLQKGASYSTLLGMPYTKSEKSGKVKGGFSPMRDHPYNKYKQSGSYSGRKNFRGRGGNSNTYTSSGQTNEALQAALLSLRSALTNNQSSSRSGFRGRGGRRGRGKGGPFKGNEKKSGGN